MPRRPASIFGLAAACLAFAALYAIAPPMPRYLPLAHSWQWRVAQGQVAMGWYGRSVLAFGAAALAGALAFAATRRLRGNSRAVQRALLVAALMALLALVGLVALIAAQELTHWGTFGPWTWPTAAGR